jgi:hypothetical protein
MCEDLMTYHDPSAILPDGTTAHVEQDADCEGDPPQFVDCSTVHGEGRCDCGTPARELDYRTGPDRSWLECPDCARIYDLTTT